MSSNTTTAAPVLNTQNQQQPETEDQRKAGPCALILFGVTGDLARKKLLPAMYDLMNRRLLPEGFSLVGVGRRDWDDAAFAEQVRSHCEKGNRTGFNEQTWQRFEQGLRFIQTTGFDDDDAYDKLKSTLADLDETRNTGGNHAFYLSIPPHSFEEVCQRLASHDLANRDEDTRESWSRVIIEKPFGHNEASAQELNRAVESVFAPHEVFRIDHYLGKETVQNLLALRFANRIFEPLWNNNHVDHVQITMAEDFGIEGRASYYDGVGAARDVIQNHLLQLLALTAMEEPISFDADEVRSEKEKVLTAVEIPEQVAEASARGQYSSGTQKGEQVIGFLDEQGFDPSSTTETYAAFKLHISTRRWDGVPFYLRSGKRLAQRKSEIAIVFRRAPNLLFRDADESAFGQNAIIIQIGPEEGASLRLASKVPGTQIQIRDVDMDFSYGRSFTEQSPDAYERLILDVLRGEPPLFPGHEEVELSWRILDPFIEHWESQHGQPEPYAPGSQGPASADALLERDGRSWRTL